MDLSIHILARDDGGIYRLVPVVIFLVIWAIGAVSSAANKSRGRQQPPAINPPRPPQPARPPVTNRAAHRVPQAPGSGAAMPPLSTLAGKASRQNQAARSVAVPPALPRSAPQLSRPEPRATALVAQAEKSVTVWLRPQIVRSQFVLSQILGKPVAFRDRPHLPSL